MNYQTYEPHTNLKSLVSCYWTLEVPEQSKSQKQRIVPDGCIEMAFILGDDIKRYTSENEYILQPRAMVLGQTIEPFYIEPTGYVKTFAVRFYPYGFANFVSEPISCLVNKETPISKLFEKESADNLEQKIIIAENTEQHISIIEKFLMERLNDVKTIDKIVKNTVDSLLSTNGTASINSILKEDLSKRRQLERKFKKQIQKANWGKPQTIGKGYSITNCFKNVA